MKLLYKRYLKTKRFRDITNKPIAHTMKMELEHLPMWMVMHKNSKILANVFNWNKKKKPNQDTAKDPRLNLLSLFEEPYEHLWQ